MDRTSIKIEIPLPRWPTLRLAKFSIRTLLLAIAMIAIAIAIYQHARDAERARQDARHNDGYFSLGVTKPFDFAFGSIPRSEFTTLAELIRHRDINIDRASAEEFWPPKIMVKRFYPLGPEFQRTIDVRCNGTYENPEIDIDLKINQGDTVIIAYEKRSPPNSTTPFVKTPSVRPRAK